MSKILAIIKLSFLSLGLHKLRSALTVLGIIFGVASVITMLAIGAGASEEAQRTIRELGSTNIIIDSIKKQDESNNSDVLTYGITYNDISRISSSLPNINTLAKQRIVDGIVSFKGNSENARIFASDKDIFAVQTLPILKGRVVSSADERNLNMVCVIDKQLKNSLFPYQDPLESKLLIRGSYFQVIGVVDQGEPIVYVPFTSWVSQFGERTIHYQKGSWEAENVDAHQLIIQMQTTEDVVKAFPMLQRILHHGHSIEDYSIKVPLKLLEKAEDTKRLFNYLLGSIAGISLLVGGIGIMNIMLATVSERTKEIGLRRAIGAKKKDIVLQFMVEAIVLSLIGGLAGVALGIALPYAITYVLEIPSSISPMSVIISFCISGITGVLFGSYPAIKSANLNPIEALRDG